MTLAELPDRLQLDVGKIQKIAQQLVSGMENSPEWAGVRARIQQMARDNSVDGILARQQAAMEGIINGARRDGPVGKIWSLQPSATEIEEAEADLRSRLPEIAERLSEVEHAADEIKADSRKRVAVERITEIIKTTDVSQLSAFGLLIVLWWLFVLTPQKDAGTDVAVVALWYAIARDTWRKD